MGFKNGAKMTLYNIGDGKGNYSEAKGIIYGRIKGEIKPTFTGFVRFVGDCRKKLDGLNDKSRIVLTDCDVERFVEKKNNGYVDYTHFVVFDFDKLENKPLFDVDKLSEEDKKKLLTKLMS